MKKLTFALTIAGLLAIIALPLAVISCSTTQQASIASFNAKFQADVSKAETWAQSPTGQTILNAVSTGVNDYVAATGGGPKSTANAAALSAAVRSVETGSVPSVAILASAVKNYVPAGASTAVLNAVVAAAASAPTPNGGLEVAAKAIDSATAPKSASMRVETDLPEVIMV